MNAEGNKSNNLEEISAASKSDISRTQKARHTMQSISQQIQNRTQFRLTQSQNYGKKKLPPTILENEQHEEDEEKENSITARMSVENERKNKNRSSQNSRKSNSSRIKRDMGQSNPGYDSNLDGISVVSTRSFDRGQELLNSGRSSTRTSSISLEVQREQYCCFSRWSPCERKLAASVAVLAAVIVILVIAVGILAGTNKGTDAKFTWSW